MHKCQQSKQVMCPQLPNNNVASSAVQTSMGKMAATQYDVTPYIVHIHNTQYAAFSNITSTRQACTKIREHIIYGTYPDGITQYAVSSIRELAEQPTWVQQVLYQQRVVHRHVSHKVITGPIFLIQLW